MIICNQSFNETDAFSNYPSLNEHQLKIGLDSKEHDDDCDLGSDLQLAGDAFELPTTHAPTMR